MSTISSGDKSNPLSINGSVMKPTTAINEISQILGSEVCDMKATKAYQSIMNSLLSCNYEKVKIVVKIEEFETDEMQDIDDVGPSAEPEFTYESITAKIFENNRDTWNMMMADFSYQGYDPVVILDEMCKKSKGKDKLADDVAVLVSFYLSRGTNTSKSLKSMTDSGKKLLIDLVKKYGIRNERPKNRKDITISRVMSVFPTIVSRLMKLLDVKPMCEPPEGLPSHYCFPAGASLLLSDGDFELFAIWTRDFAKLINSDPEESVKYADIVYRSQFMTRKMREDHSSAVNLHLEAAERRSSVSKKRKTSE
jgi:hypothetical protein